MAPNRDEFMKLKIKREMIYSKVQNIHDAFSALSLDKVEFYRPRYEKLSDLENQFTSIQNELIQFNLSSEEESKFSIGSVQKAFDDLLFSAMGKFTSLANQPEPETRNKPEANIAINQLPRLNLKQFNGTISEWNSFISLYQTLVHDNTALSEIQKFSYLQSHLSGEALSVISDFPLKLGNYQLAYDALVSRYQNVRRLAEYHFTKIYNFKSGTAEQLNICLSTHVNNINALKGLGITDLADFLLFQITLVNLDSHTRQEFEKTIPSTRVPSYEELIQFMTETVRRMELVSLTQSPRKTRIVSPKPRILLTSTTNHYSSSEDESKPSRCPLCSKNHSIYQCDTLLKLGVPERYELLKKHYRCFSCLGAHRRQFCPSKQVCQHCSKRSHHTYLHSKDSVTHSQRPQTPVSHPHPSTSQLTATSKEEKNARTSLVCQTGTVASNDVLLGTFKALIKDCHGLYYPVKGILDTGSQISAITSSLRQILGLTVMKPSFDIRGVSESHIRPTGITNCTIRPRTSDTVIQFKAIVLAQITRVQATTGIQERFSHLTLADDEINAPSEIHLLLGADVLPQVLGTEIKKGNPMALETIFGYVLMGSSDDKPPYSPSKVSLLICTPPLNETMAKFWETEEVILPKLVSPEDQFCENHFQSTLKRDTNGRYIVSLPFRNPPIELSNNRDRVLNSYLLLEKRFLRSPQLYDSYRHSVQEYLDLDHLAPASTSVPYLLPHHPVVKESSSTTKTRIVFNASYPDNNGHSLNEALLPGPKLQPDIATIITLFRTFDIVFSCDIKMMFRQVLISPAQRQYQHILWRCFKSKEIREFELKTLTFGITTSPFLAQRVLLQLAQDYEDQYPRGAQVIREGTYIDNFFHGGSTVKEAKQAKSELIALLKEGCFELRKWSSNDTSLIDDLDSSLLEDPIEFHGTDSAIKVLGLLWDQKTDCFTYYLKPFEDSPTKRNILSYIARIFDPVGWLAPTVFWVKYFLQLLWTQRLGWDDPIPDALLNQWKAFSSEFSAVSRIRIPRVILSEYFSAQVIGFCDASTKGYAAVVYLRVVLASRGVIVNLLQAKSKVAPLKVQTIPRLELMGALLLAKLLDNLPTRNSTALTIEKVHLFTDSTTVLAWLKTPPHLLQVFVCHRVVKILDLTSLGDWMYISSDLNPADLPSRGLSATQLVGNQFWWNGPSFLSDDPTIWPVNHDIEPLSVVPELKKVLLVEKAPVENRVIECMSRFSFLTRLQRVVAYILRFCHNLKSASHLRKSGPLRLDELNLALSKCALAVQHFYFDKQFRRGRTFQSLCPIIDNDGLLRVGGRLKFANSTYEFKHPIILPKNTHLSRLLCDYYHVLSLHSGPRVVSSLILKKFWIISLRSLVRQRIRGCLKCFRFTQKPLQPPMADLPPTRTQPSLPFSHVSVDFAGPFTVKETTFRKSRQFKAYLCLFVCFSTKALHLEMTLDLSTDSFLLAFERFIARRGLPKRVLSDGGRNFLGAARVLKEITAFLRNSSELIQRYLADREVEWSFSPPYAPNFNGLAEAGVKSVKSLLLRTVGDKILTIEEISSLFTRIEAILNSRPLCPFSTDCDDSSELITPGHLLTGRHLMFVPDCPPDVNSLSLKKWLELQKRIKWFWRQWKDDYLNSLQQRFKWTKDNPNLQVGDLVVVSDVQTPPAVWPFGRITKTYPGKDGVVRVVEVKTPTGSYTRSVNKLVPVPQ